MGKQKEDLSLLSHIFPSSASKTKRKFSTSKVQFKSQKNTTTTNDKMRKRTKTKNLWGEIGEAHADKIE